MDPGRDDISLLEAVDQLNRTVVIRRVSQQLCRCITHSLRRWIS